MEKHVIPGQTVHEQNRKDGAGSITSLGPRHAIAQKAGTAPDATLPDMMMQPKRIHVGKGMEGGGPRRHTMER